MTNELARAFDANTSAMEGWMAAAYQMLRNSIQNQLAPGSVLEALTFEEHPIDNCIAKATIDGHIVIGSGVDAIHAAEAVVQALG